ncbi:unnamed protein product [Cladocopium goreaui]|uniref:Small ribosomal subunit protein uS17 n=1 Tax=Cladocopium goreaui TaxID=2562237 RepID=A0A9P1BPE6_9DINO|nr:unnamed protein product [Cladocopium goreaui]
MATGSWTLEILERHVDLDTLSTSMIEPDDQSNNAAGRIMDSTCPSCRPWNRAETAQLLALKVLKTQKQALRAPDMFRVLPPPPLESSDVTTSDATLTEAETAPAEVAEPKDIDESEDRRLEDLRLARLEDELLNRLERLGSLSLAEESRLNDLRRQRAALKANFQDEGTMDQNEKAFQKQDAVFLGSKRLLTKKSKKAARYWRNIGLGFAVPKEAKEGHYVDKKCPFTGNVSIRGAILKGMCISTKMKRTIIIRRNYLHYIKKFHRFEKRHSNMAVHCSPAFEPKEGDIITAGQCRPLAKTVRFNVIKVDKNQIFGSARKQWGLHFSEWHERGRSEPVGNVGGKKNLKPNTLPSRPAVRSVVSPMTFGDGSDASASTRASSEEPPDEEKAKVVAGPKIEEPGQAVDELGMICASLAFLYVVLEVGHLEARVPWLPVLEAVYAVGFAVAYFASPFFFPVFVAIYGCTVLLIIHQAYRVYQHYVQDDSTSAQWQRCLFWTAAIGYPGGFLFLWVPENALCPLYPKVFQRLHLHAIFHIVTTMSPYCYVVFMTYYRCLILKREAEHRLGIGLAYVHVKETAP